MSLADPQSITISPNAAVSLPRVSVADDQSTYRSGDGLLELRLSSAYGRRVRRTIRFNHSKITTDPFLPTQNVKVSSSCYLVFDIPPAGYTSTEMLNIFAGFNALYTATGSLAISKLLGGES